VSASDCPAEASCVQYAGGDFCGHQCASSADCEAGESCLATSAAEGTQVMVCVPDNGTCGQAGCGTCTDGTVCDPIVGTCVSGGTGGGAGGAGGGGAAVGGGGAGGGGSFSYTGSVGADGGAVSALYFAVVGDTRPPVVTTSLSPTSGYPTTIINKIYQDIASLDPQPQFVISTGDYMYATGGSAGPQLALYMQARALFPGPNFPAMGNHECTGVGIINCTLALPTGQLTSFINDMLKPSGQSSLYYTFDVDDTAGQWKAKFIVTACNAWDSTQKSWLQTQLSRPTTYTFVVRHMPFASDGPCNGEMDPIVSSSSYTALISGHTHSASFSPTKKMLIEGVGGAPLTGTSNYGYATFRQKGDGGFEILQYDYMTNQPVATWSL
jgi:hypothetical protein